MAAGYQQPMATGAMPQATGWGAQPGTGGMGGPMGGFGAPQQPQAPRGGKYAPVSPGEMEALWEEYKSNPNRFWDNRASKMNPKAPDFKHKDTGRGLWVTSSPAWFDVSALPAPPPPRDASAGALVDTCSWCNSFARA